MQSTQTVNLPSTLKTTASHLAQASTWLLAWFLIPVVERLVVLSVGKIRICMVEGIADEAAAAQGIINIEPNLISLKDPTHCALVL